MQQAVSLQHSQAIGLVHVPSYFLRKSSTLSSTRPGCAASSAVPPALLGCAAPNLKTLCAALYSYSMTDILLISEHAEQSLVRCILHTARTSGRAWEPQGGARTRRRASTPQPGLVQPQQHFTDLGIHAAHTENTLSRPRRAYQRSVKCTETALLLWSTRSHDPTYLESMATDIYHQRHCLGLRLPCKSKMGENLLPPGGGPARAPALAHPRAHGRGLVAHVRAFSHEDEASSSEDLVLPRFTPAAAAPGIAGLRRRPEVSGDTFMPYCASSRVFT